MKQETFTEYDKNPPFAVRRITTVETVCPCCKQTIRFIVPDDIKLRDDRKYIEHLEKEIQRLHFELGKMEEIRKLNKGYY